MVCDRSYSARHRRHSVPVQRAGIWPLAPYIRAHRVSLGFVRRLDHLQIPVEASLSSEFSELRKSPVDRREIQRMAPATILAVFEGRLSVSRRGQLERSHQHLHGLLQLCGGGHSRLAVSTNSVGHLFRQTRPALPVLFPKEALLLFELPTLDKPNLLPLRQAGLYAALRCKEEHPVGVSGVFDR